MSAGWDDRLTASGLGGRAGRRVCKGIRLTDARGCVVYKGDSFPCDKPRNPFRKTNLASCRSCVSRALSWKAQKKKKKRVQASFRRSPGRVFPYYSSRRDKSRQSRDMDHHGLSMSCYQPVCVCRSFTLFLNPSIRAPCSTIGCGFTSAPLLAPSI
jgi:hypothetical protein